MVSGFGGEFLVFLFQRPMSFWLLAGDWGDLGTPERKGVEECNVTCVSNFLVWNVALNEWVAKNLCDRLLCWCDFSV